MYLSIPIRRFFQKFHSAHTEEATHGVSSQRKTWAVEGGIAGISPILEFVLKLGLAQRAKILDILNRYL